MRTMMEPVPWNWKKPLEFKEKLNKERERWGFWDGYLPVALFQVAIAGLIFLYLFLIS